MESLEDIKQEIALKKQQEANSVEVVNPSPTSPVVINENSLVNALVNNESAIDMAKEQYQSLKNQKQISKKMGNVVNKKTNADIETADLLVKDQLVSNKVKKAEQRNRLLELKNEKVYLKKEQVHRLEMQRQRHLREKYEDLLLRTCRKKQKGSDGKYHFVDDKDGNPIINTPGRIKFFFIKLFDGIVSLLNLTAEIFGAINKNVIKGLFVILILLLVFVPPFREFLLGLIGIKIG